MKDKRDFLYFGRCSKPHGIKGGLQFHLLNDTESTLESGSMVRLFPASKASSLPDEGLDVCIKDIVFGHKVMVYLEGYQDRTSIESLLPFEIYQQREELPELEEGEVYLVDLEGHAVHDEEGLCYGHIRSFYFNGGHDVVIVALKEGGTMEVPFVEPFLKSIDQDQKIVILTKCEFFE